MDRASNHRGICLEDPKTCVRTGRKPDAVLQPSSYTILIPGSDMKPARPLGNLAALASRRNATASVKNGWAYLGTGTPLPRPPRWFDVA